MNREAMDQGWQEIQFRIDQLVSQFLKEDFPIIEYKPRCIALLQMPADYKHDNPKELS